METPSDIQQLTFDIVKEIVETKRYNVAPAYASLIEIHNMFHVEILEALRTLYRRGLLTYHIDINKNPMFGLKEYE